MLAIHSRLDAVAEQLQQLADTSTAWLATYNILRTPQQGRPAQPTLEIDAVTTPLFSVAQPTANRVKVTREAVPPSLINTEF